MTIGWYEKQEWYSRLEITAKMDRIRVCVKPTQEPSFSTLGSLNEHEFTFQTEDEAIHHFNKSIEKALSDLDDRISKLEVMRARLDGMKIK